MNKICTSLEQSKKLIELGISAWSEKDENHLIHCVRLINNAESCTISEQENAINWLKLLKERIGG